MTENTNAVQRIQEKVPSGIAPEHLTATFAFEGTSVRIGKFDPSIYDADVSPITYPARQWEEMHGYVFSQLEEAGVFNRRDRERLCAMPLNEFVDCILED